MIKLLMGLFQIGSVYTEGFLPDQTHMNQGISPAPQNDQDQHSFK